MSTAGQRSKHYRIDRLRTAKSARAALSLDDDDSDADEDHEILEASDDDAQRVDVGGVLEDSESDDMSTKPLSSSKFLEKGPSKQAQNEEAEDVSSDDDDNQEEEDDDDGDENDDKQIESDSEDGLGPSPRRVGSRKTPTKSSISRRSAIQDDDDDDDDDEYDYNEDDAEDESGSNDEDDFYYDDEDEEEEEEIAPTKRRARPARSKRQAKKAPAPPRWSSRRPRRSAALQETALSDSDDEKEEEEENATSRRSTAQRGRKRQPVTPKRPSDAKRQRKANTGKKSSTFQQDSLAQLPSPKRSSALKARNKMRSVIDAEEKGSDQDVDSDQYSADDGGSEYEEPVPKETPRRTPKKTPRRTPKKTPRRTPTIRSQSSDEEFHIDSDPDSGSSGDSSLSEALDEDDEEVAEKQDRDDEEDGDGTDNSKAINIDNEEVGTADEFSDDEEHVVVPSSKGSDRKEILPSHRRGRFESDSSSSDDDDSLNGKAATQNSTPSLPACPSTVDAITAENLPRRHICYVSPDGQSRLCFRLETLRQIALKSTQLKLRVDLDGTQRQNFLQPPHFRTAACDDLLDQIASRFGRDALDLHGPFYNFKHSDSSSEGYEDTSDDDNDVYALATFRDHIERYFHKSMGNQDLYVCPLCYCHSHRLMVDAEAEDRDETIDMEGVYDPMHVLGEADNGALKVASLYCFKRASDVKKHLRSEHNVDTSVVQGNDLYMRYKIRSPDGLLQRWLAHTHRHSRQGLMRMYWGEGNNQSFILLLNLMIQAQVYAEEVVDPEGSYAEAAEYLEIGRHYFDSFSSNAKTLWKFLSAPFAVASKKMKEFIVNDDEVEGNSEEEETNHAALFRRLAAEDDESDENDLVHKLQRKYVDENEEEDEESAGDNSSSEEELDIVNARDYSEEGDDRGDGDDDDDDDEEEEKMNGYYSPVEEEKDEWMLARLARRKRTSTPG